MLDVITMGETMIMFSPRGQGRLRYINEFYKSLCRFGEQCSYWTVQIRPDRGFDKQGRAG